MAAGRNSRENSIGLARGGVRKGPSIERRTSRLQIFTGRQWLTDAQRCFDRCRGRMLPVSSAVACLRR